MSTDIFVFTVKRLSKMYMKGGIHCVNTSTLCFQACTVTKRRMNVRVHPAKVDLSVLMG